MPRPKDKTAATTAAASDTFLIDGDSGVRALSKTNLVNDLAASLPVGTRSAKGLVPAAGGSGTTRFYREDGSFAIPPSSEGSLPADFAATNVKAYPFARDLINYNLGDAGGRPILVLGFYARGDCAPFWLEFDASSGSKSWDTYARFIGADGVRYETSAQLNNYEFFYDQFGANGVWNPTPSNMQNNTPIFNAVKAYFIARGNVGGILPLLRIDCKNSVFKHDSPMILGDGANNVQWRIRGNGSGMGNQGGSQFINYNGAIMMIADHLGTSEGVYVSGKNVGTTAGSEIIGVDFIQRQTGVGACFKMLSRCRINNCSFAGADIGLLVHGDAYQGGNCNGFEAISNFYMGNNYGAIIGVDNANASMIGGSFYFNNYIGLLSNVFLDMYTMGGLHFEGNGLPPGLTLGPDNRPSVVQHPTTHKVYETTYGNTAAASTTTPGTNGDIWEYKFDASPNSYTQWFSGIDVVYRAALVTTNANGCENFDNVYFETPERIQMMSQGQMVGGGMKTELDISRVKHPRAKVERNGTLIDSWVRTQRWRGNESREAWITEQGSDPKLPSRIYRYDVGSQAIPFQLNLHETDAGGLVFDGVGNATTPWWTHQAAYFMGGWPAGDDYGTDYMNMTGRDSKPNGRWAMPRAMLGQAGWASEHIWHLNRPPDSDMNTSFGVGDIWWRLLPPAGDPLGWICTKGSGQSPNVGTPSWKPIGYNPWTVAIAVTSQAIAAGATLSISSNVGISTNTLIYGSPRWSPSKKSCHFSAENTSADAGQGQVTLRIYNPTTGSQTIPAGTAYIPLANPSIYENLG